MLNFFEPKPEFYEHLTTQASKIETNFSKIPKFENICLHAVHLNHFVMTNYLTLRDPYLRTTVLRSCYLDITDFITQRTSFFFFFVWSRSLVHKEGAGTSYGRSGVCQPADQVVICCCQTKAPTRVAVCGTRCYDVVCSLLICTTLTSCRCPTI